MQIGIIQCGHFPQPENHPKTVYSDHYRRLLSGHDFTYKTWSAVDLELPGSVHDADGWLLSGSKHGAYEDLPFIAPLEAFIRRVYAAKVPMVGICFGHQIVAQALGGIVRKRADGFNCGHNSYVFEGETKTLMAWHQDEVVVAPKDAKNIGSSAECKIAMIRYHGKALTMQPHPEFVDDVVQIVMDGPMSKTLSQDHLSALRNQLGAPQDSAKVANEIANFFKDAGENQ